MLRRILCVVLFALFVQGIQCQAKPPKVTDSYIAWGEITQPIKELEGSEIQVHFEETYDKDTENAAFLVWLAGKNVTFVKNFNTSQTFRYTEGKDCFETNEAEWITSNYPPGLLTYEDDDGNIKFSLSQLFNLPDNLLVTSKPQGTLELYRGIPAKKWIYQINGRDQKGYKKRLFIYAYWADNANGNWNTSSNSNTVPLGFIVSKTMNTKVFSIEETVTNVYGFISGAYDHKFFEPFQGVICENRTDTRPFPYIKFIKAISIHSEMVLPDYQEIKYIDTYFDPQNQLQRVDVERIREENPAEERKEKRYETETAIGKMGIVYRQTYFKGDSNCEIIKLSEYENDVQNFVNIKEDLQKWSIDRLFGLNETKYVYTGKTTKADVPCHVFQGIRKDWPDRSANVTSLWEWCFNFHMSREDRVRFRNNEFGLINAQVTIMSSDKPMEFPPGFRMFHHFYQVTRMEPETLDATTFDISGCYEETQKRYLQFYLDWALNNDNRHIAENLTSDVGFLKSWKSAIYFNTELPLYTLRLSNVHSTVADNKLYIRFAILDVHEKLPPEVKGQQITAFKAEENLRRNVNGGKVSVNYPVKRREAPTTFKAAKHSVTFQINSESKLHTLTPLTTEKILSTTPFHFTLITDPDDNRSPTTNGRVTSDGKATKSGEEDQKITPSPQKTSKQQKKHPPGTVATVSIAMLLVGLSVGCSATFYKFYGVPSCMRSQT